MQHIPFSKPVEDTISKVDNAVAVGEDLDFQRRWWRFERIMWSIFAVIIVLDVLGAFGRGVLAHAERHTPDGTLNVKYERIERASTPSIMSIRFGPEAIQDGKIQLFLTESVVKDLGAQRIIPQPLSSTIGNGGITYTFPATSTPAAVDIAFEPSFPGVHRFLLQVPGKQFVSARVAVVP